MSKVKLKLSTKQVNAEKKANIKWVFAKSISFTKYTIFVTNYVLTTKDKNAMILLWYASQNVLTSPRFLSSE